MNSLCQFIFVQNTGRLYARSGIIHPSPAGRKVTQKSQNLQRPSCVPQLIHQKGIILTPYLIPIKSVWAFGKWTQQPATAILGNTVRVQGKLPLPTVSQNSCSLSSYYKPTKTVRRGVNESEWYDNYRLYLKIIFLTRVSQPAHALALRRKNTLHSMYCKYTIIWSMEDKEKIRMGFILRQQNNFSFCGI